MREQVITPAVLIALISATPAILGALTVLLALLFRRTSSIKTELATKIDERIAALEESFDGKQTKLVQSMKEDARRDRNEMFERVRQLALPPPPRKEE